MVGRFNARDPLAGIVATWVFKLCCPRVKHLANFCLMLYRCSNFALMAPVPVCKKTSRVEWILAGAKKILQGSTHTAPAKALKKASESSASPQFPPTCPPPRMLVYERISWSLKGDKTHPKGSISRSRQV